ncbi:HoxN/HupN/NixA family nickel/cobalt transporter [Croceicoccus sp. Ery5]|uniref:HoxN/HupN/NixA family nickel/cobalt transporter n=1 Tax=Croceicoccus sp. Ery5 TaxID=1703340 RepID=UPI001E3DBDCB|nr:HoxN/HupN/NixA family nickel/cobalt transporter [Croceicoccus sp. Ery5]
MKGLLAAMIPRDRRGRRGAALLAIVLALLNLGGWGWALALFHDRPALIGIAVVVYALGLRHAVDADHIAAIDNVTRKLAGQDRHPVSTGFWFAAGHASVVLLVTLVVATAAQRLDIFRAWQDTGGTVSMAVSALFLLLVAGMNFVILDATLGALRLHRAGGTVDDGALDLMFAGRGPLSRLFRPLFAAIDRPWQMAPLGFLFGLGFDTATEVTLFGLAASQAGDGLPVYAILVFPVLFAGGMALVDTADGMVMAGAYRWAAIDPLRKLYYNMTITLMSIAVALFIGGVELALLAIRLFGIGGPLAAAAERVGDSFNLLGFGIIAAFALAWLVSHQLYRRAGAMPAVHP